MKMYMSMMILVHNYENEDEYIEVMFRLEEQFISYSIGGFLFIIGKILDYL